MNELISPLRLIVRAFLDMSNNSSSIRISPLFDRIKANFISFVPSDLLSLLPLKETNKYQVLFFTNNLAKV
tara:strand:- start:241 stop:453 length:213 start_codon:yes stop_codon:yes gene_type:complete